MLTYVVVVTCAPLVQRMASSEVGNSQAYEENSPASFRPESQKSFSYSDMPVSPPQRPANIASTRHGQYDVSPISPPPDHHRAPAPFPPPQLQQEAGSSNSDAKTTPFDALPPSLMIGSQGPRRRSPNSSFSQPPHHATNPHTNASNERPSR